MSKVQGEVVAPWWLLATCFDAASEGSASNDTGQLQFERTKAKEEVI